MSKSFLMKNLFAVGVMYSLFSPFGLCQPKLQSFDTEEKIWTDKEHFYTREPVWVSIRIENKGADGPRIVRVHLDDCIIVEDSEENRLYLP